MRAKVALGRRHEKELQQLMEKWELGLNATECRIISEAVIREKLEDSSKEGGQRSLPAFVLHRLAIWTHPRVHRDPIYALEAPDGTLYPDLPANLIVKNPFLDDLARDYRCADSAGLGSAPMAPYPGCANCDVS